MQVSANNTTPQAVPGPSPPANAKQAAENDEQRCQIDARIAGLTAAAKLTATIPINGLSDLCAAPIAIGSNA